MIKNSLIEIKNLGKIFKEKKEENHIRVLENININIDEGEFVVILGPSGCGKTTLLRIVAGLEKPTTGNVIFNGEEVKRPSKKRGMVFQAYTSFPWLNVFKNIEFGLIHQKMPKTERKNIVRKYIDLVGLHGFEESYPHQLSGGMKQRVAIARTLAMNPMALFLDEPFGALDAQTRQRLQEELLNIQRETGKTIFFVTHDIDEALILGSRIVVLSNLPGTIIHDEKRKNERRFSHGYSYTDEFMIEKRKYSRLIEYRNFAVALGEWTGYTPLRYAQLENFIPSQIELFFGVSETNQKKGLIDGTYDCININLSSALDLIPRKIGKIVFATHSSSGLGTNVLIVRKNAVKSISDLAKARIGFTQHSLEHLIFAIIFKKHGIELDLLNNNDERIIHTKMLNTSKYLTDNIVDAVILSEPEITELFSSLQADNYRILTTDIDQNLIQHICFVREDSIRLKKDLVSKYLKFTLESNEYFSQNENEVLSIIKRKISQHEKKGTFEKKPALPYYIFENIKIHDLDENTNLFRNEEILNLIKQLSTLAKRTGLIEKELSEEDLVNWIDKSFIKSIANAEESL